MPKIKNPATHSLQESFPSRLPSKGRRKKFCKSSTDADRVCTRMKQAEQALEATAPTITEWNENAVRQIVERVTVLSADEILVRLKDGKESRQQLR